MVCPRTAMSGSMMTRQVADEKDQGCCKGWVGVRLNYHVRLTIDGNARMLIEDQSKQDSERRHR